MIEMEMGIFIQISQLISIDFEFVLIQCFSLVPEN